MNHKCHGDHFTAEGVAYYRCSYRGAVSEGTVNGQACPHCGREIDASDAGAVPVTTVVQRYVMLNGGLKAVLSATKSGS